MKMNKWKEYSFSDIAEFISTKTALSEIETEQYISTENMIPNLGGVTIATALPDMDRCNSFQERDILFSNIRTYFKKVWFAQFSGGCSADVLVIRSKNENILLNEYLYLLICSEDFINYTVVSSKGTKMPRGDKKAILNFKLNIPPIPIQRNCINQYFKLNEKIQLNTQINQTLEQMAQTVFKSWFVDFDPVRSKAAARAAGADGRQVLLAAMQTLSGVSPTVLAKWQHSDPEYYRQLEQLAQAFPDELEEIEGFGEVPKGWKILKFNEFSSESKERIGEKTGIPEYSVGNHGISPRGEKYKKQLSKSPEKNKLITNGDIVFGMGSQTLNWGIMQFGNGSVSPAYFVYRTDQDKVDYRYLNMFIKAYESEYQTLIKPTSRQGQSVDRKMFLAKKIYMPSENLLHDFLDKLNSIQELILSNKNENRYLSEIRDVLLPKLLNGEITL